MISKAPQFLRGHIYVCPGMGVVYEVSVSNGEGGSSCSLRQSVLSLLIGAVMRTCGSVNYFV